MTRHWTLDECQHEFTQEVEGSVVCTSCSFVIENHYVYPHTFQTCFPNDDSKQSTSGEVWAEFLHNVIANNPNLGASDELYKNSSFMLRKLLKDPRLKPIQQRDVAAYCIYTCAASLGSDITAQQLTTLTGCNTKQIQKLEYMFQEDGVDENPLSHIGRLCYALNISGRGEMEITSLMKLLNGNSFGRRPRTIAIAMIFLYQTTRQLDETGLPIPCIKTNLNRLAKQCRVSPLSIQKALPNIRATLPQNAFPKDTYSTCLCPTVK
jgi:transcription initiation factor TFIIIB Brf1 subunit/transcription initiation factor TFIIB